MPVSIAIRLLLILFFAIVVAHAIRIVRRNMVASLKKMCR